MWTTLSEGEFTVSENIFWMSSFFGKLIPRLLSSYKLAVLYLVVRLSVTPIIDDVDALDTVGHDYGAGGDMLRNMLVFVVSGAGSEISAFELSQISTPSISDGWNDLSIPATSFNPINIPGVTTGPAQMDQINALGLLATTGQMSVPGEELQNIVVGIDNIAYGTPGSSVYDNSIPATAGTPADPTSLVASLTSANTIYLTWTDNSTNEDTFYIERSTDGGGYSAYDTVGANTTNYLDTVIDPGVVYQYRVRAGNGTNYSNWAISNTVTSAAHSACTAPTPISPTVFNALPSVQPDGTYSVNLDWGSYTGSFVYIHRSYYPDPTISTVQATPLTNQSTPQTTYIDTNNIVLGQTYTYQIKAANTCGDIDQPGTEVIVTIPATGIPQINVTMGVQIVPYSPY